MKSTGGDNSKTAYSANTNEEILNLASRMYSLDEGARSLLTDELERRSIGPDEIQSYVDAEAAKTSRPDPNSGVFAWIWPTIEDEKTAADASGRAIVISAFAVFLGIVGSVVQLLPGLSSVFSASKTPALKLAAFVGVTAVWALVRRAVV